MFSMEAVIYSGYSNKFKTFFIGLFSIFHSLKDFFLCILRWLDIIYFVGKELRKHT